MALIGSYYKIPVVAVGGSWNYNGWTPFTFEALEEQYGEEGLKRLDWIESKYLRSTVMEVGIVNPRQVGIYPSIIYKQLDLQNTVW